MGLAIATQTPHSCGHQRESLELVAYVALMRAGGRVQKGQSMWVLLSINCGGLNFDLSVIWLSLFP
jgi:hypothetical protein